MFKVRFQSYPQHHHQRDDHSGLEAEILEIMRTIQNLIISTHSSLVINFDREIRTRQK